MKKFIILFLTSLFLVGCAQEDTTQIDDSVVFDVESIIGMNAFEIIEVFTEKYGEPSTLSEPEYDFFGTVNWTDEETILMFGFDYWDDGTIDENIIVVTAFKTNHDYAVDNILNMTNLNKSDNKYNINIKKDGTTSETINIWVELK